ncbi:hypothetical protein BRYFOR_07438 [Marvinbryantia formatexigens DSM 14469]|uniref:Uncharacterized protein n=1 Tax=Marvinbryantia formatexigens DSM 14469 TaxID=478749 RepID=C6LFN5_9FIRM|nr:hypothetical protein BRYFOR_07438 [Marvinbryantia formatexigens DSM 14469]
MKNGTGGREYNQKSFLRPPPVMRQKTVCPVSAGNAAESSLA